MCQIGLILSRMEWHLKNRRKSGADIPNYDIGYIMKLAKENEIKILQKS